MAKRTEEQWRELFQQHDESDLSAAQFCRDNKLCPKYFSLRRKQLESDKAKGQPSATSLGIHGHPSSFVVRNTLSQPLLSTLWHLKVTNKVLKALHGCESVISVE